MTDYPFPFNPWFLCHLNHLGYPTFILLLYPIHQWWCVPVLVRMCIWTCVCVVWCVFCVCVQMCAYVSVPELFLWTWCQPSLRCTHFLNSITAHHWRLTAPLLQSYNGKQRNRIVPGEKSRQSAFQMREILNVWIQYRGLMQWWKQWPGREYQCLWWLHYLRFISPCWASPMC